MCSKNPSHAIFRVALSLRLPASLHPMESQVAHFRLFYRLIHPRILLAVSCQLGQVQS